MESRFVTSTVLVVAALIFPVAALGSSDQPASRMDRGTTQRHAEVIGAAQGPAGQAASTDGDGGLQVKTQNGVAYVSGGVSHDEEAAIKSMGKRFNLKLTLADRTGGYMGGAHVRIDNVKGSPVLETQSDGPLFFAKLEPGTYKIHVTADSQDFTKMAYVKSTGQEQLTFIWPDQPQGEQFHQASDPRE
jgi:hypothetical protein